MFVHFDLSPYKRNRKEVTNSLLRKRTNKQKRKEKKKGKIFELECM